MLASLADKTAAVDVEQILGRVLRMPHVQQHGHDLLNLSDVFTASNASAVPKSLYVTEAAMGDFEC